MTRIPMMGGYADQTPREISDEMTQLNLDFDDIDDYTGSMSMDYPNGDLEEGVSITQAMNIRRPSHNNMW